MCVVRACACVHVCVCVCVRACVCTCVFRCSVMSDSLQPHGRPPTRLLCPWNSPGNNTGVGCHFLLQGIFPTQGSNPSLLCLLHWQVDSLPLVSPAQSSPLLHGFHLLPQRNMMLLQDFHSGIHLHQEVLWLQPPGGN